MCKSLKMVHSLCSFLTARSHISAMQTGSEQIDALFYKTLKQKFQVTVYQEDVILLRAHCAIFLHIILLSHLAVIVVGVIGALILLTVMTLCLCKNLPFCPMNAAKSTCSTAPGMQQRYRPIDTLSTKPATYEAPPPYECSLIDDPQRRNDWHCLLENQVNDTRQDGTIFQ
ncbi:unnamed protein product [Litomosoides sigmodontis]|uniref:Uncharacterized protein n=1 Tax=Litomosoides sigmodontis TaxID=42156 RepID=A0A3P6SZR1_LITSI|nr:unnamed protein product [Litomosoides sigmodontis]